METYDPFGSIVKLCCVSSSQESRLRHCNFASEPPGTQSDDDDEEDSQNSKENVPLDSTGIVMVSLPETSEEEKGATEEITSVDIFETPPEGESLPIDHSGSVMGDRAHESYEETIAADFSEKYNDNTAVDLGRETDPGFSEVDMTQKSENELRVANQKTRVRKRESPRNEGFSVSQSKKLRILEKDDNRSTSAFRTSPSRTVSPSKFESPTALASNSRENSAAKSDAVRNSPYSSNSKTPKRKLCFSSNMAVLESQEDFELNEVAEKGASSKETNCRTDGVSFNNGEMDSKSRRRDLIHRFMYGDVSYDKHLESKKNGGKLEFLLDVLKVLK